MSTKHTAEPKWKIIYPKNVGIEGSWGKIKVAPNRYIEVEGRSFDEAKANIELVVNAKETLRQRDALLEVVKWFIEKLDDGTLIRDISKDGESDFHLRMMKFTQGLQRAVKLIADCEATKD